MNFISAFCDVLMEEVHRLEVEKSDRAKADFISSSQCLIVPSFITPGTLAYCH